jgi:hypothetical protein
MPIRALTAGVLVLALCAVAAAAATAPAPAKTERVSVSANGGQLDGNSPAWTTCSSAIAGTARSGA